MIVQPQREKKPSWQAKLLYNFQENKNTSYSERYSWVKLFSPVVSLQYEQIIWS